MGGGGGGGCQPSAYNYAQINVTLVSYTILLRCVTSKVRQSGWPTPVRKSTAKVHVCIISGTANFYPDTIAAICGSSDVIRAV